MTKSENKKDSKQVFNEEIAKSFLVTLSFSQKEIDNCNIVKIAGDASFRSYYRILIEGKSFILMFAPPSYEDILPFIKVDEWLVKNGFSAPKIFAIDKINGFILLEDFGDNTYGKFLAMQQLLDSGISLSEIELELYKDACDCLIELQKVDILQDLPVYDENILIREVLLFTDWYLKLKNIVINEDEIVLYKKLWLELFSKLDKKNQVVVLRDYHADNLMILSGRNGFRKVGLLDFQDALIGSSAYDLVSLLEDARRDLNEENSQKLFDYYLEKSKCDKYSFVNDYEILSLQRNIKIIGIFARLSLRDEKHHYLALLPRVLNFVKLRISSDNPIFTDISNLLEKFI